MADIKAIVAKIRNAVYGLDVRENIAQGIEGIAENEEAHKVEVEQKIIEHKTATDNTIEAFKIETDGKIVKQNTRIDELDTHYQQVVTSGGDSVLEIVDARIPFASLKEKLTDLEEKSLNVKDISLGAVTEEENRTLKVYDNTGEVVAIIDKDNTSFSKMEVAEITCANILQKQTALTLYINSVTGDDSNDGMTPETPLKTIMQAINNLQKYLTANVYINVAAGTYDENIYCEGFMGRGELVINFEAKVVLNGEIFVNSCTTAVRIYGKDSTNLTTLNHTSSRISAVTVYSSPYVILQYFNINGNIGTQYCVEVNVGSGVAVKSSNLNGSAMSAVAAFECSRAYVVGCKGSNNAKYSVYSASGSFISIYNAIPMATLDNWNTTGYIHGTATKTNSSSAIEVPTQSVTKTYSSTKQISYRGIDGWTRTAAYQGRYDSKNTLADYNHYGTFVLDASKMRTELNAKTIQSVNLTVKRYTESQGIGQPTTATLNFYGSTTLGSGAKPTLGTKYATVTGVSKGQEKTIALPTKFITDVLNSNINSLVIYTTDGSSYCRMDSKFVLEVTYK